MCGRQGGRERQTETENAEHFVCVMSMLQTQSASWSVSQWQSRATGKSPQPSAQESSAITWLAYCCTSSCWRSWSPRYLSPSKPSCWCTQSTQGPHWRQVKQDFEHITLFAFQSSWSRSSVCYLAVHLSFLRSLGLSHTVNVLIVCSH